MTTADLRWTPAPSVSSAPSTTLDDLVEEIYTGRHRKPGTRSISVMRLMYRPRHRAR